MRILRVITRMNGGGPAKQVAYLHKALGQSGHACKLIYGQLDEDEIDFSGLLHDTKQVKVFSCLKRPISVCDDIIACFQILSELCLNSYDVLHSHTAKAGLCARLAAMIYRPLAAFLGRPRLLVCHTFHGHVFSGYFNPSMEKKVKSIESCLWKHTDVPIALTEKLKSEIVEHLDVDPEKMQVVPLGLDLSPFLNSTEGLNYNKIYDTEFKFWIGWVGRFVPIKNPTFFIEIAKELSQLRSDVGFVLFGEGIMREELETMIQKHALHDCVKIAGWRDNLPEIYAGLSVLLNTSHNEGTPVAVIEALAAGLPVYATNVGGVKEVLACSNQNQLLNWDSPEAAQLIHDNLDHLGMLRHEDREKVVEQYSQEKLLQNLVKIYQKC